MRLTGKMFDARLSRPGGSPAEMVLTSHQHETHQVRVLPSEKRPINSGPAGGPRLLLVVCKAGWGLALDLDTCVQILEDCKDIAH